MTFKNFKFINAVPFSVCAGYKVITIDYYKVFRNAYNLADLEFQE